MLFILEGVICYLQLNFHSACDLIHQPRDGSCPNCSSLRLAACSCLLPCAGSGACTATEWVRSACWSAGEGIQQVYEAHVPGRGGGLGMDRSFQQQLRVKDWVWHETVWFLFPAYLLCCLLTQQRVHFIVKLPRTVSIIMVSCFIVS